MSSCEGAARCTEVGAAWARIVPCRSQLAPCQSATHGDARSRQCACEIRCLRCPARGHQATLVAPFADSVAQQLPILLRENVGVASLNYQLVQRRWCCDSGSARLFNQMAAATELLIKAGGQITGRLAGAGRVVLYDGGRLALTIQASRCLCMRQCTLAAHRHTLPACILLQACAIYATVEWRGWLRETLTSASCFAPCKATQRCPTWKGERVEMSAK
jgi:hypothetical protein